MGSPTVSPFLYKCNRLRGEKGFFPVRHKKDIVRRTTFFAIKRYCFPIGERLVGLSNVMLWMAER